MQRGGIGETEAREGNLGLYTLVEFTLKYIPLRPKKSCTRENLKGRDFGISFSQFPRAGRSACKHPDERDDVSAPTSEVFATELSERRCEATLPVRHIYQRDVSGG